jgi:rhamnosyltransferase subunit B
LRAVAPVVFGAELGAGFGHVRRLLPLARAVREAGHRAIFFAGNPSEIAPLLEDEAFEVRAAPTAAISGPSRPLGAGAVTFGDILGAAGFADRERLVAAARAWDDSLAAVRPVAVVCELSPFLCLAAAGGDIPLLSTGHGFILPPPDGAAFPPLYEGGPRFAEPELLANVNHACQVRGRVPLAALPRLLHGSAYAVTGLAVLDPYRELRREPPVGPPALACRPTTVAATEDLFGYLVGDAPTTTSILLGWVTSGMTGRVFVRRPRPEQRAIVAASSRIVWLEAPAPIQEAIDRADLVLHHGSMLLTEEALVAGRPQLVAPVYLEHLFTARALARMGVAGVIRPGLEPEAIAAAMTAAAADRDAKGAARAFSGAHAELGQDPELPHRLVRMVLAR